jgi:outer membrane lipoprotein-sorting protein
MKKTNNILTVFALLIVLVITSCSQDNILSTKTSDFENLRFKVNVGNPINTRAASDGKTAWSKGDQIYVSIDGDRDNLCNLVYDGSDWNVNNSSFGSKNYQQPAILRFFRRSLQTGSSYQPCR